MRAEIQKQLNYPPVSVFILVYCTKKK